MSKSYKKPSYSDYSRSHTKWAKRQASKTVRRYQAEINNGCMYKKIFPSWDIFDYKGLWHKPHESEDTVWHELYLESTRK